MTERRGLCYGVVAILALLALTIAHAQTQQRGILTSVLDKNGAPVAGFGKDGLIDLAASTGADSLPEATSISSR